jgi:hypothetical protein
MPSRCTVSTDGQIITANKLKTSIIVSQPNSSMNSSDEDYDSLYQDEDNDNIINPINKDSSAEESDSSNDDGGACREVQAMSREDEQRERRQFDYQAFNDKRVMSAQQERWNAITMLPAMFYGAYFVLAGRWLNVETIEEARQTIINRGDGAVDTILPINPLRYWASTLFFFFTDKEEFKSTIPSDDTGCINLQWLPHLHAFPPLPLLAGALGILVHAPFSFLYHWTYATKLHPSKRLEHWSRRLDHAFIHFASACMAYATSGNVWYFAVNAVYNLDCALKQFEEKVRPRRNQTRIALSILLYIMPVLQRGYFGDFGKLVFIFMLSGWFFIAYPIGGYSHAMFHVVIAFLPNVIMKSACKLEVSREQIELAARCAVQSGL